VETSLRLEIGAGDSSMGGGKKCFILQGGFDRGSPQADQTQGTFVNPQANVL
jgi:hypothetical protein